MSKNAPWGDQYNYHTIVQTGYLAPTILANFAVQYRKSHSWVASDLEKKVSLYGATKIT